MITTNGRAKAGGEQGLNGEWYDGGQFLPSSENTVKGTIQVTIRKGTKKAVEPYVWQPAPADDMLSIYDRIQHWVTDNRRECQFVKGQGFIGLKLETSEKLCADWGKAYMVKPTKENGWNDTAFDDTPNPARYAWVKVMAERFNNGERWYALSEDPFHYKNNENK